MQIGRRDKFRALFLANLVGTLTTHLNDPFPGSRGRRDSFVEARFHASI
jgi:hypothetical protein